MEEFIWPQHLVEPQQVEGSFEWGEQSNPVPLSPAATYRISFETMLEKMQTLMGNHAEQTMAARMV